MDPFQSGLEENTSINKDSAPIAMVWDSLKAFLPGFLIKKIVHVKTNSRQWKSNNLLQAVSRVEQCYVLNLCPIFQAERLHLQNILKDLSLLKEEQSGFFSWHKYFLEGEQVGYVLAQIASSQKESSFVSHLKFFKGEDLLISEDMLWKFHLF